MFAIPKGLDTDRLIVDARPSSLCIPSDTRWAATMASAASLLDFELSHDETLVMSGEDVRDFYHQFKVTRDRASQYRLVGFLHLKAFSPALFGSPYLVAGLSTMAMGDVNAVSIGQASHVGIIPEYGVASWSQLLCMRGRVPRGPVALGVVIDDVVLLEKVCRGKVVPLDSCHSPILIDRPRAAYSAVGLPRHQKKSFFMQPEAEFWGVQVLRDAGIVRPNWTRLVPLASNTVAALSLPVLSVSLLEVLAGSWVAVLSFKRWSLCLLQEVSFFRRAALPAS